MMVYNLTKKKLKDIKIHCVSRIYINGEETRYLIHSHGYVISTSYNGKEGDVRFLKHNHDADGYCIITLNHHGKKYTRKIHRLVAEAFIPNPNNLPEVNHKNGNKDRNGYWNLEWVDTAQNVHHAMKHNLRKSSNTEKMVRRVCKYLEKNKHSINEIAKRTGVSPANIVKIKNKVIWKSISDNYNVSNYTLVTYADGSHGNNKNYDSKIVRKICRRLKKGKSIKEISEELNVSRAVVSSIKLHKSWRHISNQYDI